jgi:hypothetical protein
VIQPINLLRVVGRAKPRNAGLGARLALVRRLLKIRAVFPRVRLQLFLGPIFVLGCMSGTVGPSSDRSGGGGAAGGAGGKTRPPSDATGGSEQPGAGGGGGMPTDPGPPAGPLAPGRVTLHRLNRVEYDNTVRDLLGLDVAPSRTFQFLPDEFGEGFNNNADVLTLSGLDGEKYLAAARDLAARALAPANPAARARILVCDPAGAEAACAQKILLALGRRAFRRPVTADEMAPYVALITLAKQNGDSFARGVELALQAILLAPDFLFRVELDPAPQTAHALGAYELASRLSYFLWSSMPDEPLFAAAASGTLGTPEVIVQQVRRMLADTKAGALGDNLVGQWLSTLKLAEFEPDTALWPAWDEPLRAAMGAEVRQLFATVLAGDATIGELLTARFTFANRRLGQHYGLPGAASLPADQLVRVPLTGDRRGGILRQGSFLTFTSHSDMQSPVRRGKWVLEHLLCRPPPPPPGNIPNFEPGKVPTGTLRQKLEQAHETRGAVCASCHALMDPVGFAFEHYDAVGAWREQDNGFAIDATGTLPDTDVAFDGAGALSAAIERDPRFLACVTRKLLTYATGRAMTDADERAIDDLAGRLRAGDGKLPSLIELVAQSPLLTMRQGE